MAPIVLGYWDIRGFAQPIKLLLAAAGAEFVEEFHSMEGLSKDKWFQTKPTLPLDFPNLPYLYDGDVKISQSIAIMRYLGRKFGFWPENEQQATRVDLIEQQIVDWRGKGTRCFYAPKEEHEKTKDEYAKSLEEDVEALSKFLGSNDYAAGDKLTYVDFLIYEWIDVSRLFKPDFYAKAPNVQKFAERIESIPKVKEYMASKSFMKWPICNNQASWGSRFQAAP